MLVEDEPKLRRLLTAYLQAASYEVEGFGDGRSVVSAVRERTPDLILLDLMMPGPDGLEICRELRGFSEVPIIIMTARADEIDRLLGLELGADDYMCKPLSPREVVARTRAVLRRARSGAKASACAGLTIDESSYRAEYQGRPLDLTPVEFRLLKTMADAAGRVFSRQQLLDRVYLDHRIVNDRTVDAHIKNLRRKLQGGSSEPELIHSVYGVGYKLEL
jgi:two-component system response regulator BaeR